MSTSREMHYYLVFCMLELQKIYFVYLRFYASEGRIGGVKQVECSTGCVKAQFESRVEMAGFPFFVIHVFDRRL